MTPQKSLRLHVSSQDIYYDVILCDPVPLELLFKLPAHGPILQHLLVVFLLLMLDPRKAHFQSCDCLHLMIHYPFVDCVGLKGAISTIFLFWVNSSLKSLLNGFTYTQNVPDKLWELYQKEQPIIRFLVVFVEIASKLEKVSPTFSSFNPFPSLLSVGTNDKKQI